MSRTFKIMTALLLAIGIAILCWLPFSPGFWLRWNMAAAEAHLQTIRQLLQNDVRFENVSLAADRRDDGSICVAGIVPKGTLPELQRLIKSTNPPRPIFLLVAELPAETRASPQQPAAEKAKPPKDVAKSVLKQPQEKKRTAPD
jgi:hypothetical protein